MFFQLLGDFPASIDVLDNLHRHDGIVLPKLECVDVGVDKVAVFIPTLFLSDLNDSSVVVEAEIIDRIVKEL